MSRHQAKTLSTFALKGNVNCGPKVTVSISIGNGSDFGATVQLEPAEFRRWVKEIERDLETYNVSR